MRCNHRDLASRSGSFITEVAILTLAGLLGYMFYDGLLTVNIILHTVGLR